MYINTHTHKLCTNPTITNIRSVALTCSVSTHSCHPCEPKRTYRSQSALIRNKKNAHTKLYIYCVDAEQESLTYSSSNLQTWSNTGTTPPPGYIRARENAQLRIFHLSSTSLQINPVHTAEGFTVHSQHLGHPAFTHSLPETLRWPSCLSVCVCVCRSSLSLFGGFLCPPCVVGFFFVFFF